MNIWMGLWLVTTSSWATCPDPTTHLDQTRTAILEARMSDASELMIEVESAFACSTLPDKSVLAKMWLTEGARLHFNGDPVGATQSFRSAAMIDTSVWFDEFGPGLRRLYEQSAQMPLQHGEIRLLDLPHGYTPAIDGQLSSTTQSLTTGPHLVQILGPSSTAAYAKMVMLSTDEIVELSLGHLPPPLIPRSRNPRLLIASGMSLALAGGTYWAARNENQTMDEALTVEDLSAALARQRNLIRACAGLTSFGVIGVGAWWWM